MMVLEDVSVVGKARASESPTNLDRFSKRIGIKKLEKARTRAKKRVGPLPNLFEQVFG
jgi:hypothetical protein